MQQNEQLRSSLSATNGRPKPGAYPVGSLESRVAARALLNNRLDSSKRLDFVVSVVGEPTKFNPPIIGKWGQSTAGVMVRVSRIPWGMTIEQAERISQ